MKAKEHLMAVAEAGAAFVLAAIGLAFWVECGRTTGPQIEHYRQFDAASLQFGTNLSVTWVKDSLGGTNVYVISRHQPTVNQIDDQTWKTSFDE